MTNEGSMTLQSSFLKALSDQKVPVAIYLVNGIKLQGKVAMYDDEVVLLENTSSQVVYKHAISTVVPMRGLDFHYFEKNGNEQENT